MKAGGSILRSGIQSLFVWSGMDHLLIRYSEFLGYKKKK